MPVSSLLVRTASGETARVAETLSALPGVTVSDRADDSLVVITETDDSRSGRLLDEEIGAIPGVITATLVYHNFEDQEAEPCLTV